MRFTQIQAQLLDLSGLYLLRLVLRIQELECKKSLYSWNKQSTLDPFVEEKEEDVKRLKNIQLELHADFIKVVEIVEAQN